MENLIKNPFTFKYLERIREYINIINSLILNFYILIKNIQNLILLLFDYSL